MVEEGRITPEEAEQLIEVLREVDAAGERLAAAGAAATAKPASQGADGADGGEEFDEAAFDAAFDEAFEAEYMAAEAESSAAIEEAGAGRGDVGAGPDQVGPREHEVGPRPGDVGPRPEDLGPRPEDFGPRLYQAGAGSEPAGPRGETGQGHEAGQRTETGRSEETGQRDAGWREGSVEDTARDIARFAEQTARDAAEMAREMARRAREEAREAQHAAREAARQAAREAREAAREAMRAAKDSARDAARDAKRVAKESVRTASDAAKAVGYVGAASTPADEPERPGKGIAPEGTKWVIVEMLGGDLDVIAVPGLAAPEVEGGPGDIRIEDGPDGYRVRFEPGKGSLLGGLLSSLRSGEISIRMPSDHGLVVEATAGDVDLHGVKYLRGRMRAGDVNADRLEGVDFSMTAGDFDATLDLRAGRHVVTVGAGDVDIHLVEDSDLVVAGRVSIGDVDASVPGFERDSSGLGGTLSGVLGGGSARLDLRVTTGDLDVRLARRR